MPETTTEDLLADVAGAVAVGQTFEGRPGIRVTPVHPEQEEQVAQICQLAQTHHWNVVPVGGGAWWRGIGSKTDSPVTVTLHTDRLSRITEYSPGDMIVSVQSGMPLAQLQEELQPYQQMLALDPACRPDSTLGGLVAQAAYGPSRVGYGTLRDMVTGLRVVLASGDVIKVGSKVVKNVAGYDLPKLFIGSRGSLGIITECTFKLKPIPRHRELYKVTGSAEDIARVHSEIMAAALTVSALEMVEPGGGHGGGDSDRWTLLVGCDENASAANSQVQRLRQMCGAVPVEILQNSEVAEFWSDYRQDLAGASTVIRVQSAPNQMVALAHRLRRALQAAGLDARYSFTLSDGIGKIYSGEQNFERVRLLLETLARESEPWATAREIEQLPREMPWDAQTAESRRVHAGETLLMQRIKEVYDPQGIFNPGIYARGM